MKKFFYIGIVILILFEIANVYFIMPLPGSQKLQSLPLAYFFYTWRWAFRFLAILGICIGFLSAFKKNIWLPIIILLVCGFITYIINYKMAADTMFYQPNRLVFKNSSQKSVTEDRLVLGVSLNGISKAYPIQFLGYHHQVRDSVGNTPIMVTYCTVCRTGRVYNPVLNNKNEIFRLVGMDNFNAMFEDKTTKSWWRQANGEAVVGPLKGTFLKEYAFTQTTLKKWLELNPNSLIMQPDETFRSKYDSISTYEKGKFTGKLTMLDTISGKPKSWVVNVKIKNTFKFYDWNKLIKERIIYDKIANTSIILFILNDNKSFFAFENPTNQLYKIHNDFLKTTQNSYTLLGVSKNQNYPNLKPILAYQEYLHSAESFNKK